MPFFKTFPDVECLWSVSSFAEETSFFLLFALCLPQAAPDWLLSGFPDAFANT